VTLGASLWLSGAALLIGVAVNQVGESEPAPAIAQFNVRVTYYVLSGTTYSGTRVRPGVAACSWNLPIGTRLRFFDGREVVCEDRGQLGNSGWADLWMPDIATGRRQVAQVYGDRTTVEVLSWGP
jgi:hypothetical protein